MPRKFKILLISAYSGSKSNVLNSIISTSFYPSITLEQLLSITPEKYDVTCIDERIESVDLNWHDYIVGISAMTPSANRAYFLADEFRKRGNIVVLGGYHPSAMPLEAKEHADSVVIGEAELSWPKLIKDLENKKLKPFYQPSFISSEKIPPAKQIFMKYHKMGMVQATRGCPYACKYCAVKNVEGKKFRSRPIKNVINELKSLKTKRFFFADSSLTINPEYTKKLFQEMIGLNKKFSCYGNIHTLYDDEDLLKLASDAGCEQWLIGFESIDQKTLNQIGNKPNKVKDYSVAVNKIRDHGMMIMGLFIFGFDTDKPDIFQSTLKAVYQMNIDRAGFAILTPFPGTQIYQQFENEGRILTKDWSKYNLRNVVFQPKNFSPQQLLYERNKIAKEFFSISNSIRRTLLDDQLTINRMVKRLFVDNFFNVIYRKR
ncbi:MAG: B12-binding domain-containing radical SAM protein [Candidatus Thermoplasmatota archaeon]|nr:B12-binding domain-containing radical SAM protein [Candidatus Thermoplasmatota archaeon]